MSELIPFIFESKPIRVLNLDGSPWFVAKDVMLALEYAETSISNVADRTAHVPDEWKGQHPIVTLGGTQELWCLSEPGLYFFIFRSDKPKALPFQKWVAGDVLPSIRRTGGYGRNHFAAQAKLHGLLRTVLRDIGTARDAFVQQGLIDQARPLFAALGIPMPDIELVGKPSGQYHLVD
ncbi:MAG TPA: BRO family protein [Candidatus Competibacter sp.]|nr:BRO family protein [Candidatus Competibacter sp.]